MTNFSDLTAYTDMIHYKLIAFFDKQVERLANSYGLSRSQSEYCIYNAINNGRHIDSIDQFDIEEWLMDDDFLNLEGIVE